MAKRNTRTDRSATQAEPGRIARLLEFLSESKVEIKKVTWPTRKETYQATIVVIVTVIIAAIFLQIFDAFWSRVTGYILG